MARGTLAGFASGLLGLTLLEAFLSGPQTHTPAGLLGAAAGLVERVTDPAVPAIPDRRTAGASPSSFTAPAAPTYPGPARIPAPVVHV